MTLSKSLAVFLHATNLSKPNIHTDLEARASSSSSSLCDWTDCLATLIKLPTQAASFCSTYGSGGGNASAGLAATSTCSSGDLSMACMCLNSGMPIIANETAQL